MLKRHVSSVELLPQDVVELILERLPVKFLWRLRSVSKMWKSTIETRRFQEKQLARHMQSRGQDVLLVSLDDDGLKTDAPRPVLLRPSIADTVWFPTSHKSICYGSCDGLVCLYTVDFPSLSIMLVNPTTRWQQSFPLCRLQQLLIKRFRRGYDLESPKLGFGKDKLRGTYKAVVLYNSTGFGVDNVTTCEVFDFSTNARRNVHPASPYRIKDHRDPVHLDGSLYWLTECEETKVLSLDLHTETFQVICKAPFAEVPFVSLCVLDSRLCACRTTRLTHEIWSLECSGGNIKTWKKMCSIDLDVVSSRFGLISILPIATLEKNKLLLRGNIFLKPLVIHDLHTKSYDLLFKSTKQLTPVCYFPSLFSALPN